MSDREIVDGMKAFADWHKSYMKESTEANTWKIPLECIRDPKKVWLTLVEAKRLVEHLRLCEVSVNDPFYASDCDAWALDLSCRIEQAEVGK